MLPIGIGKTDELGFLQQSMPIPTKKNTSLVRIENGKATLHLVSPKEIPNIYQFSIAENPYHLSAPLFRRKEKTWQNLYEIFNQWSPQKLTGDQAARNIDNEWKQQYFYELDLMLADDEDEYLIEYFPFDPLIEADREKVKLNPYFAEDQEKFLQEIETIKKKNPTGYAMARQMANSLFYRNRKYGFFLYPIDNGGWFESKDLASLADYALPHIATESIIAPENTTEKSDATQDAGSKQTIDEKVAWSGQVPAPPLDKFDDANYKPIKLYCTLPEWERRIHQAVEDLQAEIGRKNIAADKHIENLSYIELLRNLSRMYYEFPHAKQDALGDLHNVEDNAALYTHLNGLFAELEDRIVYGDFGLSDYNEAILKKGWELINLLNAPQFAVELMHYKLELDKSFEQKAKRGISGPYMEKEPFWLNIYNAVADALAALSATPLRDHTWKEIIVPILLAMGEHPGLMDFVEKDIETIKHLNETEKEFLQQTFLKNSAGIPVIEEESRIGARIGAIKQDETTSSLYQKAPLAQAIVTWVKPTLDLFVAYPGPHSVAQVILSQYTKEFANYMVRKAANGQGHIKTGFGILNFFMFLNRNNQEFLKFRRSLNTALASQAGLAAFLRDYDKKIKKLSASVLSEADLASGALSRGVIFAINFMVLADIWYKLERTGFQFKNNEEMLNYFFGIATASLSTGFAGMTFSAYLLKRFKLNIPKRFQTAYYYSAAPWLDKSADSLVKGATFLGFFLGFLVTVISGIKTVQELEKGNNLKALREYLDAVAVGSLTLGSLISQHRKTKALFIVWSKKLGFINAKALVSRFASKMLIGGGWGSLALFLGDVMMATLPAPKLKSIFNAVWNKEIKGNPATKAYAKNEVITTYMNRIENLAFGVTGVDWGSLNWRAVVPLYVLKIPVENIKELVSIHWLHRKNKTVQGQTMRVRNKPQMEVDDIIAFYEKLEDKPEDMFPSGFTYEEVAELLRKGEYTPTKTKPEDPRWDHPLYFQPKSHKGIQPFDTQRSKHWEFSG